MITIIILALITVILVARNMPLLGEGAITGALFLFIEGYHFYLEPITPIPKLPSKLLLFVGVYIITSATLIVLRFIPSTKKYVKKII